MSGDGWEPIETSPTNDSLVWLSNGVEVWLGTAWSDGSLKLPSRSLCRYWQPAHRPALETDLPRSQMDVPRCLA